MAIKASKIIIDLIAGLRPGDPLRADLEVALHQVLRTESRCEELAADSVKMAAALKEAGINLRVAEDRLAMAKRQCVGR